MNAKISRKYYFHDLQHPQTCTSLIAYDGEQRDNHLFSECAAYINVAVGRVPHRGPQELEHSSGTMSVQGVSPKEICGLFHVHSSLGMNWAAALKLSKKKRPRDEDEEFVLSSDEEGPQKGKHRVPDAKHPPTAKATISVRQFFNRNPVSVDNPATVTPVVASPVSKSSQLAKVATSSGALAGVTIVFTGNMAVDRDTAIDLATRQGAKVTSAVSGKTSYLVLGSVLEDGRAVEEGSKFRKMVELEKGGKPGPKPLTESEFLTLVGFKPKERDVVKLEPMRVSGQGPPPLWVDKYEPRSIKEIVGNGSAVGRLVDWLKKWNSGTTPRACLLSGPPGVGKSLSAKLACGACKFGVIEFNASDCRSKSAVDFLAATLSGSRTFGTTGGFTPHCLIMDEVDGMSAGDRGGGAALIQLIKKSKIPVIAICNDRMHVKVRSLANHCLDLKFGRPAKGDVLERVKAILEAEKLAVSPELIDQIVEGANCDVRQIFNQLQLSSHIASKDRSGMLSAFEACRQILAPPKPLSVNERLDLFFVDYELIPLLVQQNYLKCFSQVSNLPKAAALLSLGDVISRAIRTDMHWNLLPEFGLIGSVFVPPPTLSREGYSPYPEFPVWFGKYSHGRKVARIAQELQCVVATATTVTSRNIVQSSYAHTLYSSLVGELVAASQNPENPQLRILTSLGVPKSDLLEMLTQLLLPWQPDTFAQSVDAKTKALITRICNSHQTMLKSGGSQFRSVKSVSDSVKLNADDEEELEPDQPTKEVESLVVKAVKGKKILGAKPAKPSAAKKPPAKSVKKS